MMLILFKSTLGLIYFWDPYDIYLKLGKSAISCSLNIADITNNLFWRPNQFRNTLLDLERTSWEAFLTLDSESIHKVVFSLKQNSKSGEHWGDVSMGTPCNPCLILYLFIEWCCYIMRGCLSGWVEDKLWQCFVSICCNEICGSYNYMVSSDFVLNRHSESVSQLYSCFVEYGVQGWGVCLYPFPPEAGVWGHRRVLSSS